MLIYALFSLIYVLMLVVDMGASHLLLEFFEFVVFLFAVFFDFFLRFAFGVFDSFGTIWEGGLGGGEVALGE